jgi:hypothetical protein
MAKMIKVSLHPQREFSGIYYNVYSAKKFIGTIIGNKLANAFKKHGTEIVDLDYGVFKFPVNVLEDILKPYVAPKPKKKKKIKFKLPYHIKSWEERDQSYIGLYDANDEIVFELWDDAVGEVIRDGYLRKGHFKEDMIEMAYEMGHLKKSNPPSKKEYKFKVGDRVYSSKKNDEGTVVYVGTAPLLQVIRN